LYALTHAVAAKKQGNRPAFTSEPVPSFPEFTASGIELRDRLGKPGSAAQEANGAQGVNGVDGADGGEPPQNPIEKLEKLGLRNVTREARNGELDPIFERDDEIAELSRRLQGGNNALLIGETGVGKTAIVEGLAQEWKDEEKTYFFGFSALDLDKGTLEPQLKMIVQTVLEAFRQGYKVYIFADEIHNLEKNEVLDLLKGELGHPERGFQMIGATTTKEFNRYFNDPATKRRFGTPLVIGALTEDKLQRLARSIVPVLVARLNASEKIDIIPPARDAAIELCRYIIGQYPPESLIALLKDAIGKKRSQIGDLRRILAGTPQKLAADVNNSIDYAKYPSTSKKLDAIWKSIIGTIATYLETEIRLKEAMENLSQTGCLAINEGDIQAEASRMAHLDLRKLDELSAQELKKIEAKIRTRFVGHDQAVKKVADAIKRYKAGRRKKNAPIATFLFTGPTGTGKTEMAHTLAWLLFGDPDRVMTIDMAQCSGKGGKWALFGPDPGFVGFDVTEGLLIDKLKLRDENRHGVLLLDEIDKADTEVYESLFLLLDRGFVQSKKTGERYSLEDIVVIMASNEGEAQMLKPDKMKEYADAHLQKEEERIRSELQQARQAWEETVNADLKKDRYKTVEAWERELAKFEQNRAETRRLVIEKLIQQNRQIAINSFKTQTDVPGREKYPAAFLNRLEISPFDFLTPEELSDIADIQLKNYVAQVERDQKLEIVIGENEAEYQAVKQFILEKGTDLSNGARPLKRSIDNNLDSPFSAWTIETMPSGEYIIKISVVNGQVVIEETKNKSERGKQMDMTHIHGRKGLILRRLAELVAKGQEVNAAAAAEILSPPKGMEKVELWFEENPFPASDGPAQSAVLARINNSLTAEDLKLLEKDLIKLLKSENPALLALGLSMAAVDRPLKMKELIQSLCSHKDPFIAKLAQEVLSKLEEATEYKIPSGKITIPAGDKGKVDPKVSALLAGIEELIPEKSREVVRRGINTLVYAAKDGQEKVKDEEKRDLPLTLEWHIYPHGMVEIRVSNSDTSDIRYRPQEPRMEQFREKYVQFTGRLLGVTASGTETIYYLGIPNEELNQEIELPVSCATRDASLAPVLLAINKLGGEKAFSAGEAFGRVMNYVLTHRFSPAEWGRIQAVIDTHVTPLNSKIKGLSDLEKEDADWNLNDDWVPERRQWFIEIVLKESETKPYNLKVRFRGEAGTSKIIVAIPKKLDSEHLSKYLSANNLKEVVSFEISGDSTVLTINIPS
jgi:ATP-dependent Clp protease ATP-binding subunit ClpA